MSADSDDGVGSLDRVAGGRQAFGDGHLSISLQTHGLSLVLHIRKD